jgi:flagellar protein FlaI
MPADDAGLKKVMRRHPHLMEYVQNFMRAHRDPPEFLAALTRDMGNLESVNVIYPVGDPLFVHIFSTKSIPISYTSVQPSLTEKLRDRFNQVIHQV